MKLRSDSINDGEVIPARNAFGAHDPDSHVKLVDNKSPHLAWSDVPAGAKSFTVVCHDVDVPSRGDDVNQEGRQVPADLPRVDFYHWLVVDLPADTRELAEGEFADGVTPGGKEGPSGPRGTRQGLNDYTGWFAGDPDMAGEYFGYDGPCPPWNDSIVHRYHFTVYALDVERCPVEGKFGGGDLMSAMEGHVLDQARITGTYTINPDAKPVD